MTFDGQAMEEQHDLTREGHLQENQPFGNYDLIRRIDMGGMGEVYLAHQRTAFQREVAVKVIRDDLSRDPLARARFFHEAEVSSHLKHDHILPLFEFGEVDGRLFLVTPYISGGTLAQRLQAGPLPVEEVQQLFTALVQAVAYIHRRGIVHRDLKPGNILLDNNEEASGRVYVRLIDFGIATKQGAEADPPLTTAGHEIGTLAYMAPERFNGIAAPGNGIYSLGVILYQMLTGHLPVRDALDFGALPAALEAVVRRCMAENPDDRYASATDVLHAFEQAQQALNASTSFPASRTFVLSPPAILSLQPVEEESTLALSKLQDTGDKPTLRHAEAFDEADYVAPTIDVAYAHAGMGPGVNSQKKQSLASSAISGTNPRRGRSRRRPLFVIVPLLILLLLVATTGLIFFKFPLVASASVTIGPQVRVLQQVYTITAQPSQTSIDVAASSVPTYEKVAMLTSSLTGQTGQQCNQFFSLRCRHVVTPSDVEILSSQLRQSLISQFSAQMDSQLQALHATEIGQKQFIDLTASSNPDIGIESGTVTVTLTEQGSVEYINDVEVQQLARQLLARQLGTNDILVNSTVQVGQPVVEGVTGSGMVTMTIAAAGVEEYQWPSTRLQAILNHIKGTTLADARTYLRQQPGVDANSVSISIHTIFGNADTLPYSVSQIKIMPINPTSLPAGSLPALPTPVASPGSVTPTV